MANKIDKQTMLDLIIEAKRTDPETGSLVDTSMAEKNRHRMLLMLWMR